MLNKIFSIFKGENEEVYKTKDRYTKEMVKIHRQAKAQVLSSQRTVTMIENSTAFRIAKATGRLKK